MTAVLFMGLFAAVFIAVAAKDNITSLVCNYASGYDGFSRICPNLPSPPSSLGSGQPVASRITAACLDSEGLNISVAFDEPLRGAANIQRVAKRMG
jgi:hypothetical protein